MKEISNVCFDCGQKYGDNKERIVGTRDDFCDICLLFTVVAAPRDFGYLPNLPKDDKEEL